MITITSLLRLIVGAILVPAVAAAGGPAHFGSTSEAEWYYATNIAGAIVCVAFVALISCMFLGFLTLDTLDLQIKVRAASDADERRYAAALLPIVEQHHRLLVTLLLLNAIAYEALPLFLDNLIPSWAAILLSVTFLLIFGELIPSAIFIGPEQLRLASQLAPLVTFFMIMLYPIAIPLIKLLDSIVPPDDSSDAYHRGELTALIKIQYEEREAKRAQAAKPRTLVPERRSLKDDTRSWRAFKTEIMEAVKERGDSSRSNSFTGESNSNEQMEPPPLHHTEIKVVEGALKMKTKVAMDVYTPMRNVFAVPYDLVLTKRTITEIYSEGYSRVPVYEHNPDWPNRRNAIRGVLMTRQLMLIDWDHEREMSTLPLQIPPCVSPKMNLVDLLQLLQRGGSLMAFVCARPDVATQAMDDGGAIPVEAGFMGLVTLEDVLESVLQEKIFDEEDMTDRNLASAKLTHWAATVLQRFMKKKTAQKASAAKTKGNKGEMHAVYANQDGYGDLETGSLLANSTNGNKRYTEETQKTASVHIGTR